LTIVEPNPALIVVLLVALPAINPPRSPSVSDQTALKRRVSQRAVRAIWPR
jgi:hypothetical protein